MKEHSNLDVNLKLEGPKKGTTLGATGVEPVPSLDANLAR